MQQNYITCIKHSLQQFNNNKIDLNDFIINIYDEILMLLNKVSNIDKDEVRANIIEHLFLKFKDLNFETPESFCAYIFKFAKNTRSNDIKRQRRYLELQDNFKFEGNVTINNKVNVQVYFDNTGLNITELSKKLKVSRQVLYSYIETNNLPYVIKRKLIQLDSFHDPIKKANELKILIRHKYGSLKYEIFKGIGIDRASFFKACKKGISYTQYIKVLEKLNSYKKE